MSEHLKYCTQLIEYWLNKSAYLNIVYGNFTNQKKIFFEDCQKKKKETKQNSNAYILRLKDFPCTSHMPLESRSKEVDNCRPTVLDVNSDGLANVLKNYDSLTPADQRPF